MTNFFKNFKNNKYLFLITLLYFALGFINIHFALLGLICMMFPFILLFKNNKKIWCQGYCPRSNLYTKIGKTTKKHSRKTPMYFIKGNMKYIMLLYFGISLFFIIMSTIRVSGGIMLPMNILRFLIVIPISVDFPQFFELSSVASWITHLSYRFYSMMLTTTTIGLLLAIIYKPRTWCTICPIATVSDVYLKKKKN